MASVYTTYTMTAKAVEESTYSIPISAFYDDATTASAITPATFTWTLTDQDKATVNSRAAVSVTVASAITITTSGNDLALPDQSKPWRFVTVEYTYNSTLGTGLPGKQMIGFEIVPLDAVT
jgi:hypothetical protein